MNIKVQDEIYHDHDRYQVLFDQAHVCIHEIDAEGRLLSMNRACLDLIGVEHEEQVRGRAIIDFVTPSEQGRIQHLMDQAFLGVKSEFEFMMVGPTKRRNISTCFIPCFDKDNDITRLIGISSDVTHLRDTEAELHRLNRIHMMLSRCNNDLARSVGENDLLNAFCNNLVEIGGYLFAWVNYLEVGREKSIRMMAHAGHRDEDFSLSAIKWDDDDWKYNACWQSISSGRPVNFRDIKKDAGTAPWRDAALRLGARSMIAMPLITGERAFGNFSLFSATRNDFSEKEVELLMELAKDMAYGIDTARSRAVHEQKVRRLREEVEQEERGRIAATLHDGVGQSVQGVNLGLKRVRALGDTESQLRYDLLNQIIDEVGGIIVELRDISQELRPLYLERMELQDALRYHCSEQSARSGLDILVSDHNEYFPLEDRVKEQCFLGFREALNNAVKHASATRIDVVLETLTPESFSLRIKDDGKGFDPGMAFSRPSGLGLSMIAERAESVGGHGQISSTPGQGTVVIITMPLAATS